MEEKLLTCIECPMGCSIKVIIDGNKVVEIDGNNCVRGKAYVENEVFCPKRVVTSTVKTIFNPPTMYKQIKGLGYFISKPPSPPFFRACFFLRAN